MPIHVTCDACGHKLTAGEMKELGPLDAGREVHCLNCQAAIQAKRRELAQKAQDDLNAYVSELQSEKQSITTK